MTKSLYQSGRFCSPNWNFSQSLLKPPRATSRGPRRSTTILLTMQRLNKTFEIFNKIAWNNCKSNIKISLFYHALFSTDTLKQTGDDSMDLRKMHRNLIKPINYRISYHLIDLFFHQISLSNEIIPDLCKSNSKDLSMSDRSIMGLWNDFFMPYWNVCLQNMLRRALMKLNIILIKSARTLLHWDITK